MRKSRNQRLTQASRWQTGLGLLVGLIIFATVSVISFRLPAIAQEDTRAVGTVSIESTQPGELAVSWDAPTETPRDYRISWARADQDYPSREDSSANAFPTDTSYTITGLDEGVRYKVRVRARYDGSSGPFSASVEAVIASAPTLTSAPVPTITATTVPAETTTATPTVTHTPQPPQAQDPQHTATSTATPTAAAAAGGTGSAGGRERRRTELDRCAGRSPLRTVGVGQRQRRAVYWRKQPYRHDLHAYGRCRWDDLLLLHPHSGRRRPTKPMVAVSVRDRACGGNYCNTNRHAYAATAAAAGPTTHSHIDSYIYADGHPDSRADVGTGTGSAGGRERRRTELDRCAGRSPLRTVGVGQRQRRAADWRKQPCRHVLHAYGRCRWDDLLLLHPHSGRRRPTKPMVAVSFRDRSCA